MEGTISYVEKIYQVNVRETAYFYKYHTCVIKQEVRKEVSSKQEIVTEIMQSKSNWMVLIG